MSLVIGIIILLIITTLVPMVIGNNIRVSDKETIVENIKFDRYLYPEYYDCYNIDEIPGYKPNRASQEVTNIYSAQSEEINEVEKSIQSLDGPMDSPWPMYCHDVRHTGRSSYSTVDTWDVNGMSIHSCI